MHSVTTLGSITPDCILGPSYRAHEVEASLSYRAMPVGEEQLSQCRLGVSYWF